MVFLIKDGLNVFREKGSLKRYEFISIRVLGDKATLNKGKQKLQQKTNFMDK